MLFNSVAFANFFPIVTLCYFALPHKYRWALLLVASCIFYMAFIPIYILILAFTIVVDYFAGILIEKASGSGRKWYLAMSILANLGILGFFKYYDFFNANLAFLAHLLDWNYSVKSLLLILPLGLSFHTFQAMSYTIEVYRGRQKAERNFGIYALYVMFYPQLVAGPIERPQNLIHQFYEEHFFDYQRVTDGLKLMAWGLFKKVVIADNLAPFVNMVYGNPTHYKSGLLVLATFFFAYQVYCDFSGYSDIAIGAAEVMGFKLMKNFNRPYFSRSVSEFWNRWHISLSSWVKDYLFVPLSLRKSTFVIYINLFLVFLVIGLWHGANWKFAFFGFLNATYIVLAIINRKGVKRMLETLGLNKYPRLLAGLQILTMFLFMNFTFIFFRADSVSDGLYITQHILKGFNDLFSLSRLRNQLAQIGYGSHDKIFLIAALGCIVLMEAIQFLQRRQSIRKLLREKPGIFRWTVYYSLIVLVYLFGQFHGNKFIYFQF